MDKPRKTRDSKGRFLAGGGREGGEGCQLIPSLRRRLDKLLADPESSPRNIGTLTRALVSAQSLVLIEKQCALADQKLAGKSDGLNLEEVARAMALADEQYDRTREAAGKMPR